MDSVALSTVHLQEAQLSLQQPAKRPNPWPLLGQDIIAAACVQATDEDCTSDEDTVAIVTTGPRGREGFDIVFAERFTTSSARGGSSNREVVAQLSIIDPRGSITSRWFQPVKEAGQHVRHNGELAYRIYLTHNCTQEPVTAAISVVELTLHPSLQLYTLAKKDEIGLGIFFAERAAFSERTCCWHSSKHPWQHQHSQGASY